MRKLLLALTLLVPGLLVPQVAASAATSAAQIVTCSTATACYTPNPIRITTGTAVTWTNTSGIAHTATSDSGAWDTGAVRSGSASAGITFNTAGSFAYHCSFHSDMHGTIVVTAAVAATPAPAVRATAAAIPRTRALAQSGGGPMPPATGSIFPIGAGVALLGVALLAAGRRRRNRLQRVGEAIDESSNQ